MCETHVSIYFKRGNAIKAIRCISTSKALETLITIQFDGNSILNKARKTDDAAASLGQELKFKT